MPVDLTISGADRLERIGRQLKASGNKDLRKELLAGIQRAAKPLKAVAQEAARSELPKKGGLNEFVASGKWSVRTRSGGRNPGVTVVGKKSGHDVAAINRGRLRHPVFGHRAVWVTQTIRPNLITDALAKRAPDVRGELVKVLDRIADEVRRLR